jgi:hypothetical protein
MATTKMEGAAFADAVEEARVQLNGIPESGTWPLSERLSAFFFLLLDTVEEHAAGVEPEAPAIAFRREASGWFSPFQEKLRSVLPEIGASSDVHGVNRWLAELAPNRAVIAEIMVQLLQSALEDDSEDRQRSAALADRVLTVLASVWSTPIPAQVIDVLRYSIEAGYLPLDKLPIIQSWFDGDEDEAGEDGAGEDGADKDSAGEDGVDKGSAGEDGAGEAANES